MGNKKQIGLLFGSFNPIHIGHLIIAETVASMAAVDEVWFVVSPHNPFKDKKSLLNQYDRLHLVNLAIEDNYRLRASNIEFGLPQPSYTIDTLTHLNEKHPDFNFSLIMGEDNLVHFHKWKNYEQILKHYQLIVYPRPGFTTDQFKDHPKIQKLTVPLMEISASAIRKRLRADQSIRYMVHERVFDYMQGSNLYK